MPTKRIYEYKETFENRTIGSSLTAYGWTWTQYLSEASSYLAATGASSVVGQLTGSNWAGGYTVDSLVALTDCTIEFDIADSTPPNRAIWGYKHVGGSGYVVQWLPGIELRIFKSDTAFPSSTTLVQNWDGYSPSSCSTVKMVISGNDMTLYMDDVEIGTYTDSTYTSGAFMVGAYQTGWQIDNIRVYNDITTTSTNSQTLKKSSLSVSATIEFKKNLGLTLDTAVDVTGYVKKLGDVAEKLSKSAVNTGGVLLPSMNIELDNSTGRWNKNGVYFENGFINGSEFTITTNYIDYAGADVTPAFVYKGLIKYPNCQWSRDSFTFEVTLIPASSLLTAEVIKAGTIPAGSFAQVVEAILDRRPFNKYMTINTGNFSFGWDMAGIIDNPSEMTNKKVKAVLDEIMLISGSVYYVNYDGEFVIEPIESSSPSAVCTLRGDDIYSIKKEEFDWDSQYTAIKWDDGTLTATRKEMSFPDRETYQYDYRELEITNKYVTNTDNRETIAENLLELTKFIKRRYTITCKWNPEIIVNEYISIDIPEEAVAGDQFMTWNESGDNWNDGLYWSIAQMGITFNLGDLWRVLNIKRATDGEKMQIEIVQKNSDDEA